MLRSTEGKRVNRMASCISWAYSNNVVYKCIISIFIPGWILMKHYRETLLQNLSRATPPQVLWVTLCSTIIHQIIVVSTAPWVSTQSWQVKYREKLHVCHCSYFTFSQL